MDLREDSERPTSWEMRVTTYEYLDLIATCGGLALIHHDIRTMERICSGQVPVPARGPPRLSGPLLHFVCTGAILYRQ